MLLLGIESSCDETAAAVVQDGRRVLSSIVASQVALHQRYRGVVPEVASRAHVRTILPVIEEALNASGKDIADIDAVAVTSTPGLIGSLLVGLSAARTVAWLRGLPVIEVNHLEAHVYSAALCVDLDYPIVGLVVSGGHTDIYLSESETHYQCLGHTIDDAAGEAFDKVAAIMDLPYPGGPSIEDAAAGGNPDAVRFPRAYLQEGSLDFSFSGIKTAVLYHCRGRNGREELLPDMNVADVAASFQKAVVEVIADKVVEAAIRHGVGTIAVGGGVACNEMLRKTISDRAVGITVAFPPPQYCTDNAAMIAGLAHHSYSCRDSDNLVK